MKNVDRGYHWGYKVLRLQYGYFSSITDFWWTIYNTGEWRTRTNYTTCGPFAVFDNFKNARVFAHSGEFIFKCKYLKSKDCCLWHLDSKRCDNFPRGTVFADWVKIVGKPFKVRKMY